LGVEQYLGDSAAVGASEKNQWRKSVVSGASQSALWLHQFSIAYTTTLEDEPCLVS
jgi:hypothetical protein